jgi:two-component system alkaline phosphatase synthesis response regulator PhoP
VATADNLQILLVEDDRYIAKATKAIFSHEGYDVTVVENGLDALKMIDDIRPQIVLIDIMLPDISGFDVIREINVRGLRKDIHIIILSALGQSSDIINGLSLGADNYVTKPFNPEELLTLVKTYDLSLKS